MSEIISSDKILIYFLVYLLAINVITFAVYAWDKYCAVHDKWRVSEFNLLALAVIGGTIGAVAAMEVCHHKTLHLKFKFGLPVIFFLQIILVGLVYFNPNGLVSKFFLSLISNP